MLKRVLCSLLWGWVLASMLPARALAQPQREAPDWIVRGFEAAIADPTPGVASAALTLPFADELFRRIPSGDRAGAVIDKLLPLLEDGDRDVRASAVEALSILPLGDGAGAVIDKLVPLLEDGDLYVRASAVEALSKLPLGDRAGEVIDKLLPLLRDSEVYVQQRAVQALSKLPLGDRAGAVIDKLLPLLKDDDFYMRGRAVQVLTKLPLGDRAGEVIDKLLPLLKDDDDFVRKGVAVALSKPPLGDRAGAVIDKLLPLLENGDRNVRASAVEALTKLPLGDRADAVIEKLVPLLKDDDDFVRKGVAVALSKPPLGDRAGAVIDKLLPLLEDGDRDVRASAVEALSILPLGDGAGEVIDKLVPLLEDGDRSVRASAVEALTKLPLGDRADAVIEKLVPLLKDGDPDLRARAVEALTKLPLGDRAGAVIDKLLPLLMDGGLKVHARAVQALSILPLGDRAGEVIDKLLPLLKDGDFNMRGRAVLALSILPLGDRTGEVIDKFVPLLEDSKNELRASAAEALTKLPLGDRAGAVIDKLLPLLKDNDDFVRTSAAEALTKLPLGDRAGAVIDKLLPLLKDGDHGVRASAVEALTKLALGDRADAVIEKLVPLLKDGDPDLRARAVQALAQQGPGGVSAAITAITLIHWDLSATGRLRAIAHIATGGDAKKEGSTTLLAWLGRPSAPPLRDVGNQPAVAHHILSLLLRHWSAIEASPELRDEAEARVADIVSAACRSAADADTAAQLLGAALAWLRDLPWQGPVQRCWTVAEKRTVEQLLNKFSDSSHKRVLIQHLAGERAAPIAQWLTWTLIGWALFWTAFLFVFPWSRTVQALFFWNPKVRGMLSLWFVPLLLFALPPLRRRLLSPFRADLVAAARLEEMPRLGFFPDTRAVLGGRAPAAVKALLPGLRGAVILRGEAGLGKTSTLRWLAANATKPVAFLPARDCKDGVDTAIARLIQDVQETGFVRSMVYAGALVVIVDGLNEVTADTREQIRRFATDMSKGDVLIGTQPIEWQPPANARVLDLLPLDRAEAERFLLSRPIGSDPTQKAHGAAYERAVHAFLRRAVDDAMGPDARRAAELVLSNPFDLNFAADLLAQDLMPTATALIDEAFRLADEGSPGEPGYRSLAGLPFPLKRFGRHAVDMRLDDRNWFKPDEFPAEASCLLDRKLLVRRVMRGIAGEEQRIQFRHERVWDFFIDAAFQADPDLWKKHVADVRFRGAYLRIAETWNLKDAKLVGDRLARSAARNGDHTTSDEFLRRLEARDQLEVRHEAPGPALTKGASRSI